MCPSQRQTLYSLIYPPPGQKSITTLQICKTRQIFYLQHTFIKYFDKKTYWIFNEQITWCHLLWTSLIILIKAWKCTYCLVMWCTDDVPSNGSHSRCYGLFQGFTVLTLWFRAVGISVWNITGKLWIWSQYVEMCFMSSAVTRWQNWSLLIR